MDAVWEIFRDSLDMFSDTTVQCSGHDKIDSAEKLHNLFYWTLLVPRCPVIGVYTNRGKLAGVAYLTHIVPIEPVPEERDFDTVKEWEEAFEWEASYHASVHPAYRTPKFSNKAFRLSIEHFVHNHDIKYLFTFHRKDNRRANMCSLRLGFRYMEELKDYRKHKGEYVDYNLYLWGGHNG